MREFLFGLLGDGLIPVFLALLSFLPAVVVLLVIVSFFENSTTALGFGCTTLAVSALREQEGISAKRKIRFLTFIPCSAKLPVLFFLCATILNLNFFSVIGLYAFSILVGIAFCGFSVLEKPILKKVSFKQLVWTVCRNLFSFLWRTTTAILIAGSILYTLSYFGILNVICSFLEPLFIPIGLGEAAIIAALIFGLIAKEMIIGAVLMCPVVFSTASAISFLLFVLLYTPCIAALSAITAKSGAKFALLTALLNFAVAYTVAFVAFVSLSLLQ